MKKVLIAMENNTLLEKIKKCGKYIVHSYDINNKEDVIEYLKKYEVDVLITKDCLKGNLNREEYINSIRQINKNIKIILCVERLDEMYKNFLFYNNVFDIIEGQEVDFCEIFNMIDSLNKTIIFKNSNNAIKENINKKDTFNIFTKQKICVFGTSRCRQIIYIKCFSTNN